MKDQITSAEFKEYFKPEIKGRMKYRNIKTEIDGIKFDSKKEANYYKKLCLLKQSGEVTDFQMQVKYYFELNGVKLGFYKADFVVEWKSGKKQVVDVKGMKTPIYNLKAKMMKAFHSIEIFEV